MKMKKTLKKDPLLSILEKSILSLPTPFSISFMWNMGFLLGMTLMLQIISGLILSMNFIPEVNMAFKSVIHIMRDLESGWVTRYIHMNGASLFFILMYIHMARGLYFNSFSKLPLVWISGLIILLFSMMTAFMGYVLPWGQMSFWGATVITSMISAIPYMGNSVTTWIWGNFSVSQPTLNRFFSLHFILPMIITCVVMIHLIFLHMTGSSNPTGLNPNTDKIKFYPYFVIKDSLSLIVVITLLMFLVISNPLMLGDVENFNMASATTTPTHIQPEWYFLFAYAILRAIPSKLGGVLAMASAILIFSTLVTKKPMLNKKFSPKSKVIFWMLISSFMILTWVGANPVEPPFINISMFFTMIYFFLVTMI
uniref:Cytochrome b n=1 Tax=Ardeacarus ardeae TaxID=1932962 RepID=A0A343BSI2_9ACAR|nr:cytochrome b [Ardeacarus ardeae]